MKDQKVLLEAAKQIHGNKYDYSKVDYCGWRRKVCIICPEHGEFWQTLHNHCTGQGCPKCGKEKAARKISLTKDEFVTKAKKNHRTEYDYSKVEYVNNSTKVCIICPKHGEFMVSPNNFLNGSDCPKCKGKSNYTTEEFILKAREIHAWKYDYSKVDYINNHTKVCIICPEHGEFWQTPNHHLKGEGCPSCALNKKLEKSDFVRKSKQAHGEKYKYNKVNYINQRTKVCIICPEHGEFWQTPFNHMRGHGCPKCKEKESKLENDIKTMLEENNINFIFQYKAKWLKNDKPMSLDFFLPEYNIAIECQGEQHFKAIKYFGGEEELKRVKTRDNIKAEICKKHNIKLIYYGFDKSNNILKNKEEILNILKNV